MEKIRYGMIGGGARAQALMDAAIKTGEIEIAAVVDLAGENRACLSAPGNRQYGDHQAMLAAGGFDAVVLATPNDTHEEIALDVLKAGFPLFIEKPVALSMAGFEKVLEAARTLHSIVQVGVELRFSPLMNQMQDALDRGEIGRLRQIWCQEYRPPFNPGRDGWRVSARNGGTLLEKNIHHFDLFCRYANSRPVSVSAMGGADVLYKEAGVLDNALVIVEFENGVRATLALVLFDRTGFHLELGLVGEEGKVRAQVPPERMTLETPSRFETRVFERTGIRGRYDHEGELPQHRAFASRVRRGHPDFASLESVRDAHVIALAAQRAIETGERQYV